MTDKRTSNFLTFVSIAVTIIAIVMTVHSWYLDKQENPKISMSQFIINISKHSPIEGTNADYNKIEAQVINYGQKIIIIFALLVLIHSISNILRDKKLKFFHVFSSVIFFVLVLSASFWIPSLLSETLKQ